MLLVILNYIMPRGVLMKKYILAFLMSVALLFCSGCNNTEQNSELDDLINSLPTIYLGGDSDDPEEAKPSYKSITGTVSAVAKKNITVKADEKDYKFATDKEPQIFGGVIEKGLTVTVTYEASQDEGKTITPITITILDGNPDTTVSKEETEPIQEEVNTEATEESVTETSDTEAETISESSAETEETTEAASQTTAEETAETKAVEDTQAQTAAETTA